MSGGEVRMRIPFGRVSKILPSHSVINSIMFMV